MRKLLLTGLLLGLASLFPSHVQAQTVAAHGVAYCGGGGTNNCTASMTIPTNARAVVVFAFTYAGSTTSDFPTSFTSNLGNVMTGVNTFTNNGTIQAFVNCNVSNTGADTFTPPVAGNSFGEVAIEVMAIQNVPVSNCVDQKNFTGFTSQVNTITTTGSVSSGNELVLGAFAYYYSSGSFSTSPGSGYTTVDNGTARGGSQTGGFIFEKQNATTGLTGPQTATASQSGGNFNFGNFTSQMIITLGPKITSGTVVKRHHSNWH